MPDDVSNPIQKQPQTIENYLNGARIGSADALGRLLTSCQNYLLLIANRELDNELRVKVAPSDLVQESLIEANRDFGQFHGATEAEMLAWLRRILLNNIAEVRDRFRGTQKRCLGREISLEREVSKTQKNGILQQDSSLITKVLMRERYETLDRAIGELPQNYREVLLFRHQEGYSFEEIGERTGRSADASRKLWARAIEHLKQILRPFVTHDSH